jgi:hypothetical protein
MNIQEIQEDYPLVGLSYLEEAMEQGHLTTQYLDDKLWFRESQIKILQAAALILEKGPLTKDDMGKVFGR